MPEEGVELSIGTNGEQTVEPEIAQPTATPETAPLAVEDEPREPAGPGLADRIDQLTETVSTLCRELSTGNERAAARERVIDRQYEDIERLRVGERQALVRPMLVELRRLRDDLLRQAAGLPEQLPVDQMISLLESFAFSVELILSRAGVETISPAVGSAFDPSRQRAAGVVPASSPELDGTIAEVLGDGYLDLTTDRVLATATVRVRRWQEPAPPSDTDPDQGAQPEGDLSTPTGHPVGVDS